MLIYNIDISTICLFSHIIIDPLIGMQEDENSPKWEKLETSLFKSFKYFSDVFLFIKIHF